MPKPLCRTSLPGQVAVLRAEVRAGLWEAGGHTATALANVLLRSALRVGLHGRAMLMMAEVVAPAQDANLAYWLQRREAMRRHPSWQSRKGHAA